VAGDTDIGRQGRGHEYLFGYRSVSERMQLRRGGTCLSYGFCKALMPPLTTNCCWTVRQHTSQTGGCCISSGSTKALCRARRPLLGI